MDVKVTKTAGQDEDEGLEEGGGDEDDPFDTRISGCLLYTSPSPRD